MLWYATIIMVIIAVSVIAVAEAQSYDGILQLDTIPSNVRTGDAVVFSGQLGTTSGYIVPNAHIQIKDDVRFGMDDVIKSTTTGSDGRFYTTWTAQPRSSGAWDFYAIFEGSSDVSKVRSTTYNVRVSSSYSSDTSPSFQSKHSTSISLFRIPSSIYVGDSITFSGKITSNGQPLSNAFIKIMEDDPFSPDQRLGYGKTDSNGQFSIPWTVSSGLVETDFDIYAVFDGSNSYKKSRSDNQIISVLKNPTKQPTSITLFRIPSSAHVGDSVTFTGKLTADGRPLSNAVVKVLEDDPGPDQQIGYARTDSNGRFSVTWTVSAGKIELDFDIYAVFDGNSDYKRARSPNQQMTVLKYGGTLALDPIPSTVRVGEVVIFSGRLNLDGFNPKGSIVYIKDEDTLNPDDLLATAYVDSYGKFSANWFVTHIDPTKNAEIFAVYEENNRFYRLTSQISKIEILDYVPPKPKPTPTKNEYMKLYWPRNIDSAPHVAIVPTPDSYDKVRSHIVPVQEGIVMWETYLEKKYDGYWNATFELISPGMLNFQKRPDIVVNLVTHDEDSKCVDVYGYARISQEPLSTMQTVVCSTENNQKRSNAGVSATAAHEFIHAMGLGHTFNKKGDLMCSVEDGRPTCDGLSSKSRTPSNLNLAAVAQIYGKDGFGSPNNHVRYDEKFTLSGSSGGSNTPVTKPKSDVYCERVYDNYDWTVDKTLKSRWYSYWKICSEEISYSFVTDDKKDGFMVFVLPPATNVKDFINDRVGKYYTCEAYEETWHRKSNTCNIAPGSHIVLHNIEENTINITGFIKNQ